MSSCFVVRLDLGGKTIIHCRLEELTVQYAVGTAVVVVCVANVCLTNSVGVE